MVMGGKGGGTPATAQASGTNTDSLPQALEAARQFAADKLK